MGSKHAHTLIPALKKRGLDAMGMAAMLQRDHPAAASRVHDVPADMLILVMGLSDKKEADRHAVAEAVQKLAPLALFVDWRRAERNLEVPADVMRRFFFFVTRPHAWHSTLASYDVAGGLNGVLHAWRRQGRVVVRRSCLAGCVGLALVAWEQDHNRAGGGQSGLPV